MSHGQKIYPIALWTSQVDHRWYQREVNKAAFCTPGLHLMHVVPNGFFVEIRGSSITSRDSEIGDHDI